MGLLDGDIARAVRQGLKSAGLYKSATLIKVTKGTRTVGALLDGTNPTTVDYACEGIVTTNKRIAVGGTAVEANDRIVMLLGDSLAGQVPTHGDKVTIESVTQRIVSVERDAASATYLCLCRS